MLYDIGSSNPGLCDNLEWWEVRGRFKTETTYVYLWLIHVDVWQKQYHTVIILQLKISKLKMFLKRNFKKCEKEKCNT